MPYCYRPAVLLQCRRKNRSNPLQNQTELKRGLRLRRITESLRTTRYRSRLHRSRKVSIANEALRIVGTAALIEFKLHYNNASFIIT